jgi:hypothetical protein
MIRILAASRHRSLDVHSYNVHDVPLLFVKAETSPTSGELPL